MKKNLHRGLTLFISMIMLLNISVVSFADVNHYEEIDTPERSNNRYYYVYERGETETTRTDVSASEARDRDLAHYVAVGVLALGGPVGATGSAVLLVQGAIYDMNVPGYISTEVTVVKKYRVHRLTGDRHYDSSRTEMNIKVYAQENNGYSLHRSFSFDFRNK